MPVKHCSRLLAMGFALAILAVVSPASAQRKVRWNAPPEEWQWVVDEAAPGTTHHTLRSDSMRRDVGYNIYLPPSYEQSVDRRYPVVYFLHGAGGSERSDADPSMVRRLIAAGRIADVIYVYPNGGHFSKYRDWPDGNVKSETFLIRELIPHVDRTYRTIARRDGRALSGWSMGGDASLRFVCKYPDMFCAAATFSAAIDWGVEGDDTIVAYSRANADKIRGRTGLMMVVGEDDRLFEAHKKLLPHLEQLKLEHGFRAIPEVGHNLGLMKQHAAEEITLMLAKHLAKQ